MRELWFGMIATLLLLSGGCGPAQEINEAPAFPEGRAAEADVPAGTVHVPAFDLPLSAALSSKARESIAGESGGRVRGRLPECR